MKEKKHWNRRVLSFFLALAMVITQLGVWNAGKESVQAAENSSFTLYMKKEGIKYVFYQDIFRKSDNKVVVKSTVETVCVVNGRLSDSELFDRIFAPYLQ